MRAHPPNLLVTVSLRASIRVSVVYVVARATTLASLLYASPACWCYASSSDRDRLERMINKLRRGGYHPQDMPSFASLAAEADKLFFLVIEARPDHVLKHLLPPKKLTGYSLRPRAHPYEFPLKDTRNLISRVLCDEVHC